MNELTEFQQRACAMLVVKMLQGKRFSIYYLDAIAKTMGRESSLAGRDYAALRSVHCIEWSEMGPELARRAREKCLEMLGLPPQTIDMVEPQQPSEKPSEPAKRLRLAFWRCEGARVGKMNRPTDADKGRAVLEHALESLRGYRREMQDAQPCDAERALEAALAHQADPAAAGWKLVPVEPTAEMIGAIPFPLIVTPKIGVDVWRNMLAAAPPPQQAEPQSCPDDAACRDETVRQLRAENERLRTQQAEPVRKPLTAALLRAMHHEDQFGLFCDYDEFEQIARAVEQAHGIVEGKR